MTFFQGLRHIFLAPLTGIFYFVESLSLPASLANLPYNVPVRLRTPTYEGSGQATHPDILGPNGSGRPFLLTLTPYPYDIDRYENPSILASKDGLRFREERKALNPLASAPAVDHNDDPDLSYLNGEYDILYLETMRPKRQNLVLLRSADRLSWKSSVAASFELQGPISRPFMLSPALAERGVDLYLYYVNKGASPYRIEYLKGKDVGDWNGLEPRMPSFDALLGVPWHIDIAGGRNAYYMLVTTVSDNAKGEKTYDLRIARSTDLENWSFCPAPVFAKRPFGCPDVYRSSAYVDGGDIYIYFSCRSKLAEWKIGVVRKKVSDLFPEADRAGR
jgi:hypothetical protein